MENGSRSGIGATMGNAKAPKVDMPVVDKRTFDTKFLFANLAGKLKKTNIFQFRIPNTRESGLEARLQSAS